MTKWSGRVDSIGLRIKRVAGKKRVILSELKMSSSQSGCRSGQVVPYFHMIFFFFYKENNLYMPFEKSCNKLLDVNALL